MKKILIIIGLCVCALNSKAQYIANLDETTLIGNWSTYAYVDDCNNQWPVFEGMRLSAIHFADTGISSITVLEPNFRVSHLIYYYGYIVSGTSTGKYTLHFIQQTESETWNFTTPQVNFVITAFDGESITLKSYDGLHGMILKKSSASINDVSADTPEADTTIYNLNGMVVKNPTAPGIYIQGDGKKIVK